MRDDKIDFSALDPSRDAEGWEERVQEVARMALARHRPRAALPEQLVAWLRPAMVLAAALALLVWGAALGGLGRSEPAQTGQVPRSEAPGAEPALLVARWAAEDARPTPMELLRVLGGQDERN
ncbi:MAG: hypothetical protein RBU30_23270 [Polyangia bacterium]|jgi:hypothetical protein|nr:hypothetical protein [Polyangia bacterium]